MTHETEAQDIESGTSPNLKESDVVFAEPLTEEERRDHEYSIRLCDRLLHGVLDAIKLQRNDAAQAFLRAALSLMQENPFEDPRKDAFFIAIGIQAEVIGGITEGPVDWEETIKTLNDVERQMDSKTFIIQAAGFSLALLLSVSLVYLMTLFSSRCFSFV